MSKNILVIPAYNEAEILRDNIKTIYNSLQAHGLSDSVDIVIADNNSSDNTESIGRVLESEIPSVTYRFVGEQGKGHAVISSWEAFADQYDSFAFMDADLATDLDAFPILLAGLDEGHDVVIGSRYHKDSEVQRTAARKIFSVAYRVAIRILLGSKVSDFPCGFKVVQKHIVKDIIPLVENRSWFFDSEIVYVSEQAGHSIKEIPVSWQEPRVAGDESRVNFLNVSIQYLRELLRLRFSNK